MSENYSASEMMIAVAARMLKGARTVFVGVGLPNIACNLARVTVAPDMEMIYESGVYGARPERLPLSIGDPTLVSGAVSVVSMADLFGLYLQRGLVEIALLGDRRLCQAEDAATGERRRLRNRNQCATHFHDHAAQAPRLCRKIRFRHEPRPSERRRQPLALRPARQRTRDRHHR